jgi:hypothetical protein
MSLKGKSNDEIISLVEGLSSPTTLEAELLRRFIALKEETAVEEEEEDGFFIEVELEEEVEKEEEEESQMMPIAVAQVICAVGMLVTGTSILLVAC